ncbi:MAG TPA: guanylate kinase [Tissierellaceae bacterium]
MAEGFLLVVSGPSGSGKGTVCKELLENIDELVFSVSATTRSPRPGEIHGENYFFLDKDEFATKIENNEFLEYANVHTNYYGTPKDFVIEKVKSGKIVLLEIDVQGAMQVMERFENVVSVFLLPPNLEELEQRLRNRNTESNEDISIRLANAKQEIDLVEKYDYYVINDEIEFAVDRINSIIKSEKLKVKRNKNIKEEILKGR